MLERKGLWSKTEGESGGKKRGWKKMSSFLSLSRSFLFPIAEESKRRDFPLFPFFSLQPRVAMSPQLIETTESDTRVVVARFVAALAAGKVRTKSERFDGGSLFHRCLLSSSSSSTWISTRPLSARAGSWISACVSRTHRDVLDPSRMKINPLKKKRRHQHTGCGFGSGDGDDQRRVPRLFVVSGRGRRVQRQDGRVRHGPRGAAPRRLREGRPQR